MKIKVWLGILVSGIFLYLFARQLDYAQIWETFKSVNYLYLLLAGALQLLTLLIRAERWKYIIEPLKKISGYSLFTATTIGFMANYLLPARMGEVIKAYVIGNREKISKSSSFATVVVERLFDGFSVLLFLVLVVMFYPFPESFYQNQYLHPHKLKIAGMVLSGIYIIVLGGLLVMTHYYDRVVKFIDSKRKPDSGKLWDKVIHVINSFSQGLESLKGGRHLGRILLLSLMIWVVISSSIYVAYQAFEFQLPFFSAVLLTVIIAAAVAIPSSPGFIGTYHFACAIGLILLGVEANKANSFAILLHAVTILPVIILGLVFVAREGLNLKQLQEMESE